MSRASVNLVCALQSEAQPLIEYFGLQKSPIKNSFSLFVPRAGGGSGESNVRVLISGVGNLNMAAAIAWLAGQQSQMSRPQAWLNIGSAGHRDLDVGEVVRIGHCHGDGLTRDVFPPLVAKWPGKVGSLLTVHAPSCEYPQQSLVDMEGTAFFATAYKFAPPEIVQAIKVVSDNQSHHLERLTATLLTEMIACNLASLVEFIAALQELANQLPEVPALLGQLSDLTRHLKLTHSHQYQLASLVQDLLNINVSDEQLRMAIAEASSAESLLGEFSQQVAQTPVNLP